MLNFLQSFHPYSRDPGHNKDDGLSARFKQQGHPPVRVKASLSYTTGTAAMRLTLIELAPELAEAILADDASRIDSLLTHHGVEAGALNSNLPSYDAPPLILAVAKRRIRAGEAAQPKIDGRPTVRSQYSSACCTTVTQYNVISATDSELAAVCRSASQRSS